jgi:hypothetical protein
MEFWTPASACQVRVIQLLVRSDGAMAHTNRDDPSTITEAQLLSSFP